MEPIEIVINGTDKGFLKTLQQAVKAENEMKDGLEKIKRKSEETSGALDRMGASSKKMFGLDLKSRINEWVMGFGSMGAAASMVRGAMQQLNQEMGQAAATIDRLKQHRKEMSQLGGNYGGMKATAERISMAEGISQEDAYTLSTAAKAGGFESSLSQVARAAATYSNAGELANVAATIPDAFNGQISQIDSIKLVSRINAEAKALNFTESAHHLTKLSEAAPMLGASPEESGAMIALLSSNFATSTGDKLKGFASGLALHEQFRGQGFMGSYDLLKKMPEDERKKILGSSQEMNTVFYQMDEREKELRAAVQRFKSGEGDPYQASIDEWMNEPENAASRRRDIARQGREITNQQLHGITAMDVNAVKDSVIQGQLKDRLSTPVGRLASEWAMHGMEGLGGNAGTVSSVGTGVAAITEWTNPLATLSLLIQEGQRQPPQPKPIVPEVVIPSAPTIVQPLEQAAKNIEKASMTLQQSATNVQQSRHDAANRERIGNRE